MKQLTLAILLFLATNLPGQTDSLLLALENELGSKVPESFLDRVLNDARLTTHEKIVQRFAKPYENLPPEKYKALLVTEKRIDGGVRFHNERRTLVHEISRRYGVDEYILLAIIGIESNYGNHHEEFAVVNALFTQATKMPKRRKWATGQLATFLEYCYEDSIDPFLIKGSYAGAFGYGQFIPTSYIAYAVDADSNGVRDPHAWDDALGSIANYLIKNGYDSTSKSFRENTRNWKAVFAYNHSKNYVNAVMELRQEIKAGVENEN
ncbi:MAG: lytic transglycosylase domain-containing protein [Fidelibacterota bacterium]